MADFILIVSGFIGIITAAMIAAFFFPTPKSFSTQELGHMAFALVGLIVGIIIGDVFIIQNFF